MAFSGDSKIKDIMDNDAARAVLAELFGGEENLSKPQMKMAMGMTLNQMCRFPQAGVSDEALADAVAKLEKIE
ncbi:MAG: hypothetical protein ACOYIK_08865 [Coriobacteriales bacterium]|jgi:hypothetical protein